MAHLTIQQAFALALQHHQAGRLHEAERLYRMILAERPEHVDAMQNLGLIAQQAGRKDVAVDLIRRAVALSPNNAEAHSNLGNALKDNGQLDEAIAACRRAIALRPNLPEAHANLGAALAAKGRFDEAIAVCRRAIALRPNMPEAYTNLGVGLAGKGQFDEAIAALRQAIVLMPGLPEARGNLGNALRDKGQLDEAVAAYHHVLSLKPNYAEAHNNLGIALTDLGRIDEAIASYRRALQLKSDYVEAHSNLLLAMLYLSEEEAASTLAEHRAWSAARARPLESKIKNHGNDRSPERRLRIGYVSADFHQHPVRHFLQPLLEHHDRANFEIYCYCNSRRADNVTAHFKHSCNVWRDIVDLPDEEVAAQVRSDAIDVLVDLSGHTGGNRLCVFARRPAPVQTTYLGYANTTGMTAIDYRLTDALADPPGMTDALNVEKLWRLPGCAWCYHPSEDAPEIQPRGNGPITFGCFNAYAKINARMVDLWAQLLKRAPGSRLLLKSTGAGQASSRRRLTDQFAQCGISSDRIEMRGQIAGSRAHLELYGQVDVALDTYPYHGTTTTCESLWMGVPVVSLSGRTHISRVGVSLLTYAGLPELIAQTPEEYVRLAAALAGDLPRLAELRRTLRPRMQASALLDAPRFALDVEAAYRQMWRAWCLALPSVTAR
jgi:predicted O-linked N-acetylglucosamine transferase (SPINDLY family)